MLKSLNYVVISIIVWHLLSFVTLAQNRKPTIDKFSPNPLETNIPDSLIRSNVKQKPLTAEELKTLEAALDELNQQATIRLETGDQETAFSIWNRELRLRRFLGLLSQVQAISRVGAIAWRENNREQVQYITQSLRKIETQLQNEKSADLQLWRSLGVAYQNLRSPQLAVKVYERVLSLVKRENDPVAEVETLNQIGELHLNWFNYSQAAITYQELLNLAVTRGDRTSQLRYLQQLAYTFEQSKQPLKAINILNQLASIYNQRDNQQAIPRIKIAIAENYQSLVPQNPSFLQPALNSYQEAYIIAWQLQMYLSAGEALEKLIDLYRSQNQIGEALQASKILLETQTLARNFYGLMQAYDQLGNIYLQKKESANALIAFEQGLKIARELKYQEGYFVQKIAGLKP
ncbi:tetratricopeptide repeat protein [Cylindrospermopsis raciborskii LB2897]|jgi:tetratricopeptide (TPR) repeat protein|uniref:tetratricopeptide repeat protein n=1 Tax=Cylindrospermopsis raciborskii TaxID=77022 RepID=UPI001454D092|nr:tetratricopeptide repeat protein [Cylindrospermopsis raciborskii]MBG0744561.1 tetratricopeptide repeat protein [Cylindrospermopsis raciborskii KL1]NLQ07949.1 tetratricopeptide repeat protein [Cylindrospermopsis raciborskii LB2897]